MAEYSGPSKREGRPWINRLGDDGDEGSRLPPFGEGDDDSPEPTLRIAVRDLQDDLMKMASFIGELGEKLDPVLRPDYPDYDGTNAMKSGDAKTSSHSALHDEVDELSAMVRAQSARLNTMMRRLDI